MLQRYKRRSTLIYSRVYTYVHLEYTCVLNMITEHVLSALIRSRQKNGENVYASPYNNTQN